VSKLERNRRFCNSSFFHKPRPLLAIAYIIHSRRQRGDIERAVVIRNSVGAAEGIDKIDSFSRLNMIDS
jgi:hypothetical protein